MSECRVCFSDSVKDLLISPCLCRGSVKYIHIKCLTKWLQQKYDIQFAQHLKGISGLYCELCHYEYKGKSRFLGLSSMLKKFIDSQSSLTILLNIFIIVYVLYKMKVKASALVAKLVNRQSLIHCHKGAYAVLRIISTLFSSAVYMTSLPMMIISTWSLTKDLVSKCFTLDIESTNDMVN